MMKKAGIIRRKIAVLLIVALSINSFAAVVSDNDGSAFITKAEFDSLKNNFQSQIDSYNQSIDSKIDGAIASYLSGINIAKTTIVNTLDDYSGGARSIVADSWTLGVDASYVGGGMNWSLGYVGFNLASQTTELVNTNIKYADATAKEQLTSFITKMNRNATNFSERLIKQYDSTSGQASWHGFCTTTQNVTGSTYQIEKVTTGKHFPVAWKDRGSAVVGTGSEANPYQIRFHAFMFAILGNTPGGTMCGDAILEVPADRTPITEKTLPIIQYRAQQWGINATDQASWENMTSNYSYTYSGVSRDFTVTPTGLSFTRTVDSISEKYVILCDNDTEYIVHRLSDLDLVSGWTTERDVAFSTGIGLTANPNGFLSTLSFGFIGCPAGLSSVNRSPVYLAHDEVFQAYHKESDTEQKWFKVKANIGMYGKTGMITKFPYSQRPYFGFMNEITDWRKISDGNYGSLVDIADIKTAQKEGSGTTLLNHDGKELMIGAGLPVIKLEKDKEYKFTMKIDTGSAPNETGDYYIWFKDGTFTDGKKPQNESNLYEVTGITKDATGFIMPKGEQKEITLKATRDGYLFCKWRCKALNGGGILYINKDVACTSED